MKRFAVGSLLITTLFAAGACGPADDSSYGYGGVGDSPAPQSCSSYSTCGACTPIVGCGWCTYPDGTGSCASSADSCGADWTAFNWDPSGCPGATSSGSSSTTSSSGSTVSFSTSSASASSSSADAGRAGDAGPSDAASAVSNDGAPTDATSGSSSSDDASSTTTEPPIIADGGGCTENDGSLCGSSQPWGVTCVQTGPNAAVPEPPPSLGCSVVDAPTPAGTLYYCCAEEFGAPPPVTGVPR